MIYGNPFILGSKAKRHESQKHCRRGSLHACLSKSTIKIWQRTDGRTDRWTDTRRQHIPR